MRIEINWKDPVPVEIEECLREVEAVLEKHGVILGHEDGQGSFLARLYGDWVQYPVGM